MQIGNPQVVQTTNGPTPETDIRKMRPADCKAVAKFCEKMMRWMQERYLEGTYPVEAMEFDIRNHSADRLAEDMKSPDFFGFLALHDGHVCGIAQGQIYSRSGLAKVTWVAVDPDHQHEGLGIRLMTAVEEHLMARGCHKIFLNTIPSLIPAIRLYMKFGLLPEAYLRKHWWGVDFIVMGKWIGEYKKA